MANHLPTLTSSRTTRQIRRSTVRREKDSPVRNRVISVDCSSYGGGVLKGVLRVHTTQRFIHAHPTRTTVDRRVIKAPCRTHPIGVSAALERPPNGLSRRPTRRSAPALHRHSSVRILASCDDRSIHPKLRVRAHIASITITTRGGNANPYRERECRTPRR